MASPSPPAPLTPTGGQLSLSNGVRKMGYLRKQKHGHRRFFVLHEPAEGSPARLLYYESEKKWRNRSAAKRCIALDSCLCVNKRADARHRHLLALYTKDEYLAVAADSEQEQESWHRALTELMARGRLFNSPQSTSSLVGFDESSYSLDREVWQVNLKARGLGQVKNLVGVYRLCLSGRSISFVKLNAETPAVSLQLMNIRRCGHSDNFFFMEVGRSAVTGPGEFWMQAEDAVVAQNIHETILESMKSMKELSEFRPRSKSQSASTNPISASTNPISVPTRRTLNQLPPSQTGLVRRSRAESAAAAVSPGRRGVSCRVRTSSEGDGTAARPVSMSIPITASPTGHMSHMTSGRTCKMLESASNLHHSRSTPGSGSPPAGSSPLTALSSMSSLSSLSTPDKIRRPFSCSASICGSLSDNGLMLCDDYSCSPSGERFLSLTRSDTPDSLCSTPPAGDPCGYMVMEGSKSTASCGIADGKAFRKRTHSLTTPRQNRVAAPLSSCSLDEHALMLMSHGSQSASPKVSYPEDYGDIEIGSSRGEDDGYMPMTPGVASQTQASSNYVPMSPMCVSAPKQITNPRVHPQTAGGGSYKAGSPCGSSLDDSGYMRMLCGSKSSMESLDRHGEYMNMSPGNNPPLQTPPDYFTTEANSSAAIPTARLQALGNDSQYVLMSPQNSQSSRQRSGDSDYYAVMQPEQNSPLRSTRQDNSGTYRGRGGRPNRLSLDAVRTLPSMNEHPTGEPRSPGEYINIQFTQTAGFSPPSATSVTSVTSADSHASSTPSGSDHTNLHLDAKSGDEQEMQRNQANEDYQDMTFGTTASAEKTGTQNSASARRPLQSPFLLDAAPDPDRSAKVIRAHPQGRRRHSSETFMSTATVTPVTPSFAPQNPAPKRHSSVENLSSRSSEGSDDEAACSVSPRAEEGAGYKGGLRYLLLEGTESQEVARSCKGVVNGLHVSPYVCLGFKEPATTAKN